MSFRIQPSAPVPGELVRIIREQIDRALEETHDDDLPVEDRIHQVRKRCKKIRALLRLYRPMLGDDYAKENRRYRDLARRVSEVRDAQAMVDAVDDLIGNWAGGLPPPAVVDLRGELQRRKEGIQAGRVNEDDVLDELRKSLREGRAEIEKVSEGLPADTPSLAAGLKKTYNRGRRAFRAARDSRSTGDLHEWRKRVKYLRYQYRLLQKYWPRNFKAYRKDLREMADILGRDHDLAVLADWVQERNPDWSREDTERFFGRLHDLRIQYQEQCIELGRRVFRNRPRAVRKRVQAALKKPKTP